MTQIIFGTDGWRGRIAEDYTFDNVRRCAQGFASFLQATGAAEKGAVIGYDSASPPSTSPRRRPRCWLPTACASG